MCVCVCVRERERERVCDRDRERESKTETDRERQREGPPTLRAGSNRLFQALGLFWRAPESGDVWYS